MLLTVPTTEYSRQIRSYRDEFLECADSMDGTGGLEQFDDPQDWIEYLQKHKDHQAKEKTTLAVVFSFVLFGELRGVEPERAEGSGGAFRSEHARGARRTADLPQAETQNPLRSFLSPKSEKFIKDKDNRQNINHQQDFFFALIADSLSVIIASAQL